MNRSFTAWEIPGLDENATLSDFSDLANESFNVLKRASGVTDEFDPHGIKNAFLSKLDNSTKNKIIIDMAGLLYFRACPLAKFVNIHLSDAWDTPQGPTPSEHSQANAEIDELETSLRDTQTELNTTKDELLASLRKISLLQDEVSALKDSLLNMKDSLLERSVTAVQSAVQNEIQSYSSVLQSAANTVQETCNTALAPSKIRNAIASAAEDRSANLIVYGLNETNSSSDSDKVKGLFETLSEAPILVSVDRLGRGGGESSRPVRVVLRSREIVRTILGKSVQLKDSEDYREVYIAPDRTFAERVERRELVLKLKERREQEPEKDWRIKGNSIIERESK